MTHAGLIARPRRLRRAALCRPASSAWLILRRCGGPSRCSPAAPAGSPLALTLGRIAAAVAFLGFAAKFGAAPLLAAFLGFLLARAAGVARGAEGRLMPASPLASTVLFHLGPVAITRPVVTTWAIMAVLALACWFVTRRLALRPDRRQAVLELIVTGIMGQIEEVIRRDPRPFLPLLGTLFIFLVAANLSGVLPGVEAPTGKLETPAALALIVFFAVHYFGVRARGLARLSRELRQAQADHAAAQHRLRR